MREIKFRVWDKATKQMHNVIAISFGNWVAVPDGKGERLINWSNVILLQYTGLKDSAGAEIWEDSIIGLTHDGDTLPSGVVRFEEGGFVVNVAYGSIWSIGDFDATTIGWALEAWKNSEIEARVIGNIHDNPPEADNE